MNEKLDVETVIQNLDEYSESDEINFDLVSTLHDDLLTESVEKKPQVQLPYYEEKKQRALKYYNNINIFPIQMRFFRRNIVLVWLISTTAKNRNHKNNQC